MADKKRQKGEDGQPIPIEQEEEEHAEEEVNERMLDPAVLAQLELAQKSQEELERINDEASDRVLEIEQEYNRKRRPAQVKRNEACRAVPKFWVETLSQHPRIAPLMTQDDLLVLEHCVELDVEDADDIKSGYSVTLTFNDNPFFTNKQLKKTYIYNADSTCTITGTEPQWKENMASLPCPELTALIVHIIKAPRSGLPEEDPAEPPHRDYRFLMWFMDETLQPGQHDKLADIIKDEIWLNPMKFYTGEAMVADDDGMEDYDEEYPGMAELPEDEQEDAVEGEEEAGEGLMQAGFGEGEEEEGVEREGEGEPEEPAQ